ncbi:unnamed protein product [Colias eurytheme]|nr:unnamed protein product [Colias eurytheme]
MGMWVRRYESGSLYVHIEDGCRGCAGRRGAVRGAGAQCEARGPGAANTSPLYAVSTPPPRRNGRDHAALSDDKNAIIMAPEYFLLLRSKYPLRIHSKKSYGNYESRYNYIDLAEAVMNHDNSLRQPNRGFDQNSAAIC